MHACDIPWRSASRSKKVPRSRDPLSRSFYFFLFYRTIPNRTTPCMRILSGRHLRGAFQHSRFRLHDNNVTRHSRWVVVRSTYHFAGGEGREGQTILSRSAKLPVGRLRTCGDRDCGAQAAARGGLRYYTAPSQRRMQYPHPRPRPLRPCASLSLFLSLSLSLKCRRVDLPRLTPSRGTVFSPPLLVYCVIVIYVPRARLQNATRVVKLGCEMPTLRFFYLLFTIENSLIRQFYDQISVSLICCCFLIL